MGKEEGIKVMMGNHLKADIEEEGTRDKVENKELLSTPTNLVKREGKAPPAHLKMAQYMIRND